MALGSGKNIVIDADAINVIANDDRYMDMLHENCILTPHMGEMSRLINREISDIANAPYETALFKRIVLLSVRSDGCDLRNFVRMEVMY